MAVEPGQIRRHRLLRTEATYRVLGVEDDLVRVVVVVAPGLAPGDEFRLALSDVEQMQLLDAEPPSPG